MLQTIPQKFGDISHLCVGQYRQVSPNGYMNPFITNNHAIKVHNRKDLIFLQSIIHNTLLKRKYKYRFLQYCIVL